jgi:thiol:disulfide interchange protein
LGTVQGIKHVNWHWQAMAMRLLPEKKKGGWKEPLKRHMDTVILCTALCCADVVVKDIWILFFSVLLCVVLMWWLVTV